MSNRRIFTEEFKAGAVQLVVSSGRSVKEVATELGIKEGTVLLQSWGSTVSVHIEAGMHSALSHQLAWPHLDSGVSAINC